MARPERKGQLKTGLTMTRPDFWPNAHQELLLTAALADSEFALSAWQDWQSRETIKATDTGSLRLLPLVYFNLARLGLSDSSMVSLKGAYIRTRLANRLRLTHLGRLLGLLASQEIPTMLLKGAALLLQVYRDPGLRPMADLDIAVPHRCAERAMDVLKENGWSSEPFQPGASVDPEYIAAVQFRDSRGFELDLHFSPFHDFSPFFRKRLVWTTVEPFWLAATPLRFGELNTLTLSATDQLLHTLEHGAFANMMPPIRWVADATWLLRGDSPILWDRFIAQAATLHLSLVASRALAYLRDKHGADIPTAVLSDLRRSPSALEVLEYVARRHRLRRLIAARNCWANYARQYPDRKFFALILGFLDFLKAEWSTRNLMGVTRIVFKKLLFGAQQQQ